MAVNHWRSVPPAHRRWVVLNAVIGAAVSNLLINAAIAWVSSIGHPHIPLWSVPLQGGPNLLTDTFGTFFLLPFTTCIVVTLAVRQVRGRGLLGDLEQHQQGRTWLSTLPTPLLRRAATLGLWVLVPLGPLAAAILAIGFGGGASRSDFILYKTVLGLVLGFVVTPLIALAAMGDAATQTGPTAEPAQAPS
ncbi:MAG TPA: hypothetical protein VG298_10775 [Acidimicrobiales bacterium]|nr:hypothetical protein [Acidimicrobiales bacterium]